MSHHPPVTPNAFGTNEPGHSHVQHATTCIDSFGLPFQSEHSEQNSRKPRGKKRSTPNESNGKPSAFQPKLPIPTPLQDSLTLPLVLSSSVSVSCQCSLACATSWNLFSYSRSVGTRRGNQRKRLQTQMWREWNRKGPRDKWNQPMKMMRKEKQNTHDACTTTSRYVVVCCRTSHSIARPSHKVDAESPRLQIEQ